MNNNSNLKQAMPNHQTESAFIGRQPIFNRNMELYAYELLYRRGNENVAGVFDGDNATTTVIINTFLEIGFENIVGGAKAFINLALGFLDGTIPLPLGKKEVVLEILENTPPLQEIMDQIQNMRDKGYKIALDDYVFDAKMSPFLDVADLVKVDLREVNWEQLPANVKMLRDRGLMTLAEKVETQQEFEACKEMGFDYFQGYFLSKPQIIEGKKVSSSKLTHMELLSKLQDPDIEFGELEKLIARDAALSYKLLRYINSPAVGLSVEVDSIQRALLMLGLDTLKQWMTLLVLVGVSDKPDELIHIGMVRATMCENLAKAAGIEKTSSYFIVGVFSILDAMLDLPMKNILTELPLQKRLNQALVEHLGDEGDALSCVIDYEEGKWDELHFHKLTQIEITRCYLDSVRWADNVMKEMKNIG